MMPTKPEVRALYQNPRRDGRIECVLCPHRCVVADGKRGICRLRGANSGVLWALEYGECVTVAVDPIEKKPLYHFHPSDVVLSTGPNGCNLNCLGCQNADISLKASPTQYIPPADLVGLARRHNVPGIAYTYTEPLVWFEYLSDAAGDARAAGLYNVVVTNGFLEAGPALEIAPRLDAANVDVKSLSPAFYKDYCRGQLEPVLRTCEIFKKHLHLEITNLLVTDANDGEADVVALVKWVATNLGKDTPVHFSRYFPRHKYEAPATPIHHLLRAKEIADRDLLYVYIGNVADVGGNDTLCPACGNTLIRREGYRVDAAGVTNGKCSKCGRVADVVV